MDADADPHAASCPAVTGRGPVLLVPADLLGHGVDTVGEGTAVHHPAMDAGVASLDDVPSQQLYGIHVDHAGEDGEMGIHGELGLLRAKCPERAAGLVVRVDQLAAR